ncbi:uncharacterized protein EKO05_0006382 [Ascochyta rabiei]|uniref:Metal ion binding n=1 Tax=Didymella rabiei TaxID=5454 RepID=A0A163A101_DIDRA|nr:uncharacterized protein EKO05_0006382 [Ascochyta rabiei]KZM20922.1 metal ion binding [Ascochyta rabiei]UPX15952.1 hypothetical protein EKO05_0006382 [Ascochyta rabiei]
MASKESGQCPHFNIHSGVCGCPEFWVPAQRLQIDRDPSTLRDMTNTHSDRNTADSRFGPSVNHIPVPSRTKTQPVTTAPPGPPKETCFFWYHGSCRRGDDCDRPHEAHPTWPIPPPPGFRHFQPCMLPLCPLRADLAAIKKPQEYQRRCRAIGGQMDGAAFSRATTSSRSSSYGDNSSNTNADTIEIDEHTAVISCDHDVNLFARFDLASWTSARDVCGEEMGQKGEGALHQEAGSHEFDKSGYIDLLQPSCLPSNSYMQEEVSLSISHPGTLGKHRQAPSTHSSDIKNKRVKLAEGTAPDFGNAISILERPRVKSHWDIKPPSFEIGRIHHLEAEAVHLAPVHISSPQLLPILTANKGFASSEPQPFHPPKGPRSTNVPPLICFFFYHKGYCNPKRGRRCGYLHAVDTSQQTVSLPNGIDNHDPMCPLQLCPVRLQTFRGKRQEPALVAGSRQLKIKFESTIPSAVSSSSFYEKGSFPPRHYMTAMQSTHSNGILGNSEPQPSGIVRRRMEQKQLKECVAPTEFAFTVDDENRTQGKKRARRRRKGGKGQARANAAERLRLQIEEENSISQGRNAHSNTFGVQRSLPSFCVKEGLSTPTVTLPIGDSEKMRREPRYCIKKPPHNKRAQQSGFDIASASQDMRGSSVEATQEWTVQDSASSPRVSLTSCLQDAAGAVAQNDTNKASETSQTVNQDPRRWWPLSKDAPNGPPKTIVAHEYSQASLGLSRERRRAAIHEEQHARREAFCHIQEAEHKEGKAAREETAYPGVSVVSPNKTAVGTDSATEYKLPEGDQRLDWDTDLVRRLFGEIE